jgi:hypothetical protein
MKPYAPNAPSHNF